MDTETGRLPTREKIREHELKNTLEKRERGCKGETGGTLPNPEGRRNDLTSEGRLLVEVGTYVGCLRGKPGER